MTETDHDDHRRENDHLVEPMYGALDPVGAPSSLLLRCGLWILGIVVGVLVWKLWKE
ncbi:MAG: hypothetical protein GY711_34785 [bacterium]|nr:hypothetical protein [bacterium]